MDSLVTDRYQPPGDPNSPTRRGFHGTPETYKTKICNRWQGGHCRFNERCAFAHGEHELRVKPSRRAPGGGSSFTGPVLGFGDISSGSRVLTDQVSLLGDSFPTRTGFNVSAFDRLAHSGSLTHDLSHNLYAAEPTHSGMPAAVSRVLSGRPSSNSTTTHIDNLVKEINTNMSPAEADLYVMQQAPVTGPNGWIRYLDFASGEFYYHNALSGKTQWIVPVDWTA